MVRTPSHRRFPAALPVAVAALALLLLAAPALATERIKDLAQVEGVRGNPLVGYGLVVGLDGTGDRAAQSQFTIQSLKSLLDELGVTVPANINPQTKNVAAVAIHAELPPFARPGQAIDVTVSSISNAISLRGGALLMAPLKGADGQVYAIAQGNLVVGGFGAAGSDGSRVSVNVPSAGRIPNGAIVERAVPDALAQGGAGGSLMLNLHQPDFTTASRMVDALNAAFGESSATALDAGTVQVQTPTEPGARVAFLARVENLTLDPGEMPAKVVVNARTGTVVIGSNVQVRPAAVAHGALTVTITEALNVSQPAPFSEGETVVVPESTVEATVEGSRMFLFKGGTSLDQIVRAVNEVGAAPGDVIAILEALKQSGALRAELEII